jgi:hypothetical protein
MAVVPKKLSGFVRRRLLWSIALYNSFISFIVEHPILFIPAIMVYLGITVFNAAIAYGLGIGIATLIASDSGTWERLAIASGFTYFAFSEFVILGDYYFSASAVFFRPPGSVVQPNLYYVWSNW